MLNVLVYTTPYLLFGKEAPSFDDKSKILQT